MKFPRLLLLPALGSLLACTSAPPPAVAQPSPVIAIVNEEEITEEEFSDYLSWIQGELQQDPQPVPQRELFQDYVRSLLLLQEAEKLGITVGEDEVRKYMANWTPLDAPVAADFSDDLYQFLVSQKLLRERVLPQVEVTLSELQQYYERNADQFVVEDQVRVREILTATRAEAVRIRSELEDGNLARFSRLALEHSLGMTAESGGNLGSFQRGELPEEFERVIFELAPGEVSEPFQSSHGYHLFMVEEWIPEHPQKFFEVREEIFDKLMAAKEREATSAYLSELWEKSEIEVFDPDLAL